MRQDQKLKREIHTVHFAGCNHSAIGLIYVPAVTKLDVSSLNASNTIFKAYSTCDDRWRVLLGNLNSVNPVLKKLYNSFTDFNAGLFIYGLKTPD